MQKSLLLLSILTFLINCEDSIQIFDGDEVTSIVVADGDKFRIGFYVDPAQDNCKIVNEGDPDVISYDGSESTPHADNPELVRTYFNFEAVNEGTTSVTINCTNDDVPTDFTVRVE